MIEVAEKKDTVKIPRHWLTSLQKFSNELHTITTSTEGEFLTVGGNFQDFWMRADEMAKISSSAAELVSGKKMTDTINGLEKLISDMWQYVENSDSELDINIDRLKKIRKILQDIFRPLEKFKRIVKTLKMMSIATRIESSRLGKSDAGFGTLADEIKKLATTIALKSGDIINQSGKLDELMEKSFNKVVKLQSAKSGNLSRTLHLASDSLLSLRNMNRDASAVASEISEKNKKIYRNVEEVVTSIQFHDITRQQIEHVKSAIDDACKWLKNSEREEAEALMFKVREICKLQKAQLKHSRDEIVRAVNGIIKNLYNIAVSITEMTEETKKMVGDVDRTGASFLVEIERHISSVTASLIKSAHEYKELSDVTASAAKNAGQMTNYVNDIKETGTQIELIALNARIKATHTGERGAAMGAIAEAIQQLSVESKEKTVTVLEVIENMSSYAEEIFAGSDSNLKNSLVENMVQNLKCLIESMNTINERILSFLKQLEESGIRLSSDIDKTVGSINVHNEMSEAITKVMEGFDTLIAEGQHISISSLRDKERYLKEMETRYTMDSERKIHHFTSASPDNGRSRNIKSPEKNKTIELFSEAEGAESNIELFDTGADMGDNVELFDTGADMGDNVELFDAGTDVGDNVELFDTGADMGDNVELFDTGADMGDNVELFDAGTDMGDNVELFDTGATDTGDKKESEGEDEDLGDNVELF